MLRSIQSRIPNVTPILDRWGNNFANWIIYDPKKPGRPSITRIANAAAIGLAGLMAAGCSTTYLAAKVTYDATDGHNTASAAAGIVWAGAFICLTRYAVRYAFDLKKYLG